MMRNQVNTNGLFSRFLAERKKNLNKSFLFICAANMAVCQDIAPVSLRHGRKDRTS